MAVHPLKGGMQPLRPTRSPEEQDQKLREVSSMYEKQFLREMMKAMRGTVQESGLIKANQAEKIFREQLDGEYVEKWAEKGGIGLADMIHQQLLEKYGTQLGIKAPIERPKGPLPLTEKTNFTGHAVQETAMPAGKVTFRFDRNKEMPQLRAPGLGSSLAENALKAPWDGVLTGSKKLGADEYLMQIRHDDGLNSRFVFRGLPGPAVQGGRVQAGQTIGVLSPEAQSFFWTLESKAPAAVE